jgi:hypothetical protein
MAGWRRWLWSARFALLALLASTVGIVVGMALWFQASPAPVWIAVWAIAILGSLVVAFRFGLAASLALIAASLGIAVLWWSTIAPSNDRNWRPEVAQLLTGEIGPGDPARVSLHNVRNFDWRTETDFTEAWETRAYDLDALSSVDMILTYWAGPTIAHTIVSFGFEGGEHVLFSVSIRPTVERGYSSIAGFFKVFELIVTAADERDAIRLRTDVQAGNTVQLFRVALPQPAMRELFLDYVELGNELAAQPRFYRTILDNCTTVVWKLVDRIAPGLPLDYRVLLSGLLPGYMYDLGALDMRYPLAELEAISVLPGGLADDLDGPGYSAALRAGVPPLRRPW